MITFGIGLVVGVITGAVVCYLVLRNNPKLRGSIDNVADAVDREIKDASNSVDTD